MIKFRHFGFTVSDLETSKKFYEKLGFKEIIKNTEKGGFINSLTGGKYPELTYSKLKLAENNDEILLELYEDQLAISHKESYFSEPLFSHFALTVDNVYELFKILEGKGVKFICSPILDSKGKNLVCFCEDPDGNRIELVEELEK